MRTSAVEPTAELDSSATAPEAAREEPAAAALEAAREGHAAAVGETDEFLNRILDEAAASLAREDAPGPPQAGPGLEARPERPTRRLCEAELPDSVDFDGVPQDAIVALIQCSGILDSEGFGSGLASSGKFPVGSLPDIPGPSDAGGMEAGASRLASSSPPRQCIPCPSSVLPAVSNASAILPAPSGDLQFCLGSQHGAPVIPRNSPAATLPPGADACNHGVTWSSMVQQNTPGGPVICLIQSPTTFGPKVLASPNNPLSLDPASDGPDSNGSDVVVVNTSTLASTAYSPVSQYQLSIPATNAHLSAPFNKGEYGISHSHKAEKRPSKVLNSAKSALLPQHTGTSRTPSAAASTGSNTHSSLPDKVIQRKAPTIPSCFSSASLDRNQSCISTTNQHKDWHLEDQANKKTEDEKENATRTSKPERTKQPSKISDSKSSTARQSLFPPPAMAATTETKPAREPGPPLGFSQKNSPAT
ncbi:hypothetical protein Nepgr_023919 [Nepenthes gracilis]|uniref:Uncharacterized protein n=1 Tax=Nepenthes gracilis TaxID=150966 RepID=A0AAD3T3Q8_NEPGR|nr:hypothetical protein Nepgr_023919 [Nepenthes gracilis]